MLSSMCQHVVSLQFVSYGQILFETVSLFCTKVIFAGLPIKVFPWNKQQ